MNNPLLYWSGTYINASTTPAPIIIQETRTVALLDDAENYKMAVDTFSIDTTEFPIFVCEVRQDGVASDPDVLDYYVEIVWGANTIRVYLIMESTHISLKPPSVAKSNSQDNPLYYGIYSFGQFIRMVNIAFASLYTTLSALAGWPVQASPPFLTMNSESGCVALVVPQLWVTQTVDTYISQTLMDMLNLPYSQVVLNAQGNLAHLIKSNVWTTYCVRASVHFLGRDILAGQLPSNEKWGFVGYYICTDHDYRSAWYDIYRIFITSNLASMESVSTSASGGSIQSNSMNVLASYTLDLVGDGHINGQLLYTPELYRWLSILTQGQIQTINIQFMYADRRGRIFPLLQTYNRLASIRLLFQRKDEQGSSGLKRKRESESKLPNFGQGWQ